MNTQQQIAVYHEHCGEVFRKIEGEAGISYISIPLNEISMISRDLLVRHGNPSNGRCGYYPLQLLFTTPDYREYVAQKSRKRPPSENWVQRMREELEHAGLKAIH